MPSARSVRKPPSRSRIKRAICSGCVEVPGRQFDVEGDQHPARADRDRTGALMCRDVAFVGQPAGLRTHVGEKAALRSRGRLGIVKGRNAITFPNLPARFVREIDRVVQALPSPMERRAGRRARRCAGARRDGGADRYGRARRRRARSRRRALSVARPRSSARCDGERRRSCGAARARRSAPPRQTQIDRARIAPLREIGHDLEEL